jgi:hypothetical protein
MRKWPRVLIAGLIIGQLGPYPLLAPPAHRIDTAHFERIQNGMTLAEVESIFGQPAGNYDWAVAEANETAIWNLSSPTTSVSGFRYSTTIAVDSFSNDSTWIDLNTTVLPIKTSRRHYTTVFGGLIGSDNKTWTSRHGSGAIWFDENLRVTGKSGWGESRIEPPWSKWWKKIFGE